MTTDAIRLWKTIDMDLCHDLDTAIGAGQYSGGLARSPLKKSSVAILGINWGGASPEWNHNPVILADHVIDDMG
jgi:hypothetical protein